MAREPGTQVEVEDRRGRGEIARILSSTLGLCIGLLFVTACAPTRAQKAEADIASVRKEVNAKTLVDRGKGFAAVGDETRAEEYLTAALDAGADPREVLPLLIDVCVRTGRYRSAIQHGENHLRKHPNDLRTRVIVGALYAAINDGKQARAQLEHVVSKPDGSVDDVAKATTEGEPGAPSLARDPSSPSATRPERLKAQAHYLLGVVARDSENDVVEADRHFREYLRIEPNGSHAEEAKSSLLKRMP